MRSLQPLCISRNNSEYYVAAKLSDGMERGFNFGLFRYCCGLVVNLYRKNRNPAINLLVGKSQLCTLCYGVTCARSRNRGKQTIAFRLDYRKKRSLRKKIHICFSSLWLDFYSVVHPTIYPSCILQANHYTHHVYMW